MQAVTIEQFPGLDLRSDPGEGGGAIDLLNVTFEPGRVRVRDGSATFRTTTDKPYFLARFRISSGANQLIIGENGGLIRAVDQAGSSIATTTVPVLNSRGAAGVAVGTPTNSYFYLADLTSVNAIRRWDGATWTTPAAFVAFAGVCAMAVTPSDNRLMVANNTDVVFSDAGAPETFGANNYVRLTPGDGESIRGAISFNNQVFVFKQTKFFVFYGQSTDATGQPVFNYRTVDTGIGMQTIAPQSVCRSEDGVYFIGNDGIYRTTGGTPSKISGPLDPFFVGGLNSYWRGSQWGADNPVQRLAWVNGKLYAALGATTGTNVVQLFEWDPELGTWSCWGLNACSLLGWPSTSTTGDGRRLMVGNDTTGSLGFNVGIHRFGLTADADTSGGGPSANAILSRYRSAFNSFGTPGQKRLRETLLTGSGTVGMQWSTDDGALPLAVGSAVTLGAASAVATKHQRAAYRGRNFSYQLDGGLGGTVWAINRVQANIHPQTRPVGITVQP